MKKYKRYSERLYGSLLLVGCLTFLFACSENRTFEEENDHREIEVGTSLKAATSESRSWQINDEIGIYMFKNGNHDDVVQSNAHYIMSEELTSGDAKFIPYEGDETLFFPDNTSAYDFIAYYPYQELNEEFLYEINLTDQSDCDAIDLLYSNNKVGVVKTDAALDLEFEHVLAKFKVEVYGDDIGEELIEVKAGRFYNHVKYNIKDGTFVIPPTQKPDEMLTFEQTKDLTDYKHTYEAVVVPQSFQGNELHFEFYCNGKHYVTTPKGPFDIQGDKEYTYIIHLSNDEALIESIKIKDWIDGGAAGRDYLTISLEQMEPIQMVYIPGGEFYMGDASGATANAKQHHVKLRDFYMSQYEITNKQFCYFLNHLEGLIHIPIGHFDHYFTYDFSSITGEGVKTIFLCQEPKRDSEIGYDSAKEEFFVDPLYELVPVSMVSWYGALLFAAKLGCRLPTEAQWEYAAAGYYMRKSTERETQAYFTGAPLTTSQANIFSVPGDKTVVGSYAPNNYGLYDMFGNVMEWCYDFYAADYGLSAAELASTVSNPSGPTSGTNRIARGGDYYTSIGTNLTVFARYVYYLDPEVFNHASGFRVVYIPIY